MPPCGGSAAHENAAHILLTHGFEAMAAKIEATKAGDKPSTSVGRGMISAYGGSTAL